MEKHAGPRERPYANNDSFSNNQTVLSKDINNSFGNRHNRDLSHSPLRDRPISPVLHADPGISVSSPPQILQQTQQELPNHDERPPSYSPLRSKSRSLSRSPHERRSMNHSTSPSRMQQINDNQERMRKSQERIATILGLDKNNLSRPLGARMPQN